MHQVVERGERLLDGIRRIEAVDLVKVDRVDAEPAEAGLAALDDVLAREAAHVGSVAEWEVDLGGEDDLIEAGVLLEGAAGDLLALPERVHPRLGCLSH